MPFLGWILRRLATRPRQRDWRHHRTRCCTAEERSLLKDSSCPATAVDEVLRDMGVAHAW